jgi:thioredoxin reductase (NADPH)
VTNLPGVTGTTGRALRDTLLAQLSERGVTVTCGERWTLAPEQGTALSLVHEHGDRVHAPAVVLATGVRRRRLGVPGETLEGVRDNVGPDPAHWRDRHVVIVGGGDDAFEHVALLAPVARSVTLVHRSDDFRARPSLLAEVLRHGGMPDAGIPVPIHSNVTVVTEARLDAVLGETAVAGVRIGARTLPADVVFRCIGPEPDTTDHGVPRRPDGAVDVDALQRSRRPGVFAVGDACSVESPTLPTAFGHGSTAAKALLAWRTGAPWRDAVPRPQPAPPEDLPRDRLRVEGLALPARVGVYAHEHQAAQTLRFTLEFAIDAARAARTDALADTLDYASATSCVEQVLATGHIELVETVAERVADALLARFDVSAVLVRVAKGDVPRVGAQAIVEVRRTRR